MSPEGAQLTFPFVEFDEGRSCALNQPRPTATKPPLPVDMSPAQYSFRFMVALVHLKNRSCAATKNISIENYYRARQNTVLVTSKYIRYIVEESNSPIRFVPMRLHVYLDHHLIVYFSKNFGADKKLQRITEQLEARGKYFFGDVVQLKRGYLREFLSDEQIEYLRSKLGQVKDFDIEMRAPKWTSPLKRPPSPSR